MTVMGFQFDRAPVHPADDALIFNAFFNTQNKVLNYANLLAVTASGLSVSVDTGAAVIQGRGIKVTDPETLSVAGNTSGYICLTVDLTQQNTVSGSAGDSDYEVAFGQIRLEVIQGSLTQDDLQNGGFIFNLPLASYTSDTASVTLTPIDNLLVPINNDSLESVLLNHGIAAGDSGWKTLPLANGTKFVSSGPVYYAKYRIKNGIVYIQFNGVDPSKSTNNNQLFVIPSEIQPAFQFNGHGTSWTSGGKQVGCGIVMQTSGVAYANWNSAAGADGTNINGSFSYPLG